MNAAGSEIIAHRLRPPSAKRDVVLARAALVGMTFNGEGVLVVNLQPLRLLLQRGNRLRGEFGRVGFEEHPIADVDHEILLAARRRAAAGLRIVGSVRASGRGKGQGEKAGELCRAEDRKSTRLNSSHL